MEMEGSGAKAPSGRPGRPTRALVLEREKRAWYLRCRGKTYAAIATELAISDEGARKICRRIEERESRRLTAAYHRRKALQCGQLDLMTQLEFDAYFESLQPQQQVSERVDDSGAKITTTTVSARTGNPAHLDGVRATLRDVRELLGMNVAAAANDYPSLTDIARDLAARSAAYESRTAGAAGAPIEEKGGADGDRD